MQTSCAIADGGDSQVIFLHGLGDTADGWADEMAKLAEEMPHIKFILPTGTTCLHYALSFECKPSQSNLRTKATRIPVTLYGGEESTAWVRNPTKSSCQCVGEWCYANNVGSSISRPWII